MAIVPVPTGRSSDLLASQRLLQQLRDAERDLLVTQTQLSTGRRIFAPSEDAPAAQRAITLQRLVEQKQQIEVNLQTSGSYLAATDTALSSAAGLISDIRGLAITIPNVTTGETQRLAAIEEIDGAITRLLALANQSFRGRHLFAGGRTTENPFTVEGDLVAYQGNDVDLRSYADVDLLVATNTSGQDVFGAYSTGKDASVDWNPILTDNIRLADLRGGAGIDAGSIAVSDGSTTSIIDLSSAETLEDVVRLIEANPPDGRTLTVRFDENSLSVEIDSGGGVFTIREVGGGHTASQLGILENAGAVGTTISGGDLDPQLTNLTQLDDILGVRARALVTSPGIVNDLVFEFNERGSAGNGLTVQFTDDSLRQAGPGLAAGSEVADFTTVATSAQAGLRLAGNDNDLLLTANSTGTGLNNIRVDVTTAAIGNAANVSLVGNVLTLEIDSGGATTVSTLQNAINLDGNFTATFDTSLEPGVNGAATIDPTSAGAGVGNTGNSGADANTLLVRIDNGNTTANDIIAAVQNNPATDALFNVFVDGKDNSGVVVPGSGEVDADATGVTAGGSGIEVDLAGGLQIDNGDETHSIDLSTAETVEDLLNLLNNSGAYILAEINADGTAINLRSRLAGGDFHIGENGGLTATQLGLRTFEATTLISDLNYGTGISTRDGDDFTITRTDGVSFSIDVDGLTTVGGVIDAINNHAANVGANTVTAALAAVGGGIELTEANAIGGQSLTLAREVGSLAAFGLGFFDDVDQTTATGVTSGTTQVLTARDANPLEADGVFNSLLRLKAAVEANDIEAIGRATELLDIDLNRVTFARGDLGARSRNIDTFANRLADEQVQLQSAVSAEIDADLVEAISRLTAQQAAFQASLQASARTFNLSLLDFI